MSPRAPKPPRLAVLLRRLCREPERVDDDEVLGRCERAALASALTLAGELQGELTAVAMGRPKLQDRVLAVALRAGCHHAVRIDDGQLGELDYLGVAQILASALERIGADLVLCGDRSQDEQQGATGPAVAQLLELPHLASVVDVRADDDRRSVIAVRRAHGSLHELRCELPALLCVAAFPPNRRPPDGEPTARGGAIEELELDQLELDPRSLTHRQRFLGQARAARSGANALMVASVGELVERLEADRIIGRS